MDKIDEVLTRSVKEVLPDKDALAKLMQKKKIKIYLGIDPSNPQIHLGNAVALRKLRQFQDLGHKVILLIGDFTGMIGDPTDKSAARKKLTKEEVEQNANTYKEQAAKILRFEDPNPAEVKFNSKWLGKLSSADWIELISNLTSQQLEERDMFVARKKEGKPIFMHEMIYPIMQGYDSVIMAVDLEIGGTDQTFNMLVGRHLMKTLKNKEKFVLTVPLLIGTDGQKMGKSTGNFIPIDDKPADMFGKIMSIRDDLLQQYFELCTDIDPKSVDLTRPLLAKKKLAFEIVKIYHGEKAAKAAEEKFESVHQKGALPKNLDISVNEDISVIDAVSTLVSSKSQAKRLIDQGAVEIDGQVVKEGKTHTKKGQVLKVGKKTYAKVEE